jgi:hypothetical protein
MVSRLAHNQEARNGYWLFDSATCYSFVRGMEGEESSHCPVEADEARSSRVHPASWVVSISVVFQIVDLARRVRLPYDPPKNLFDVGIGFRTFEICWYENQHIVLHRLWGGHKHEGF